MESMEMIGGRIKKARKELKLSQQELAGEDFTKSYISKIERGLVNPSMKALEIISDRLDKPISYFMGDGEKSSFDPQFVLDGQTLYDQGKYDESLEKFNKVLEFKDDAPDDQLIKVYYYVADIYHKQKKYKESADICKTAIDNMSHDESLYVFKLYYILAESYYDLQRRDEALEPLLKAEKLLSNQNIIIPINDKIEVLFDLGVVYLQRGKTNLGKEYLDRIVEISKKEKIITETVLSAFTALSEVASYLEKDADKSLSYLNHHIEWLYEYFDDHTRLAMLYDKYCNSYLGVGNIDKVKEYLSKMEKIVPSIEDREFITLIKSDIKLFKGLIAKEEGDIDKCEVLLMEALNIAKKTREQNTVVLINTKIAEMYYDTRRLNEALVFLIDGKNISEKIRFMAFLPDIYQLMGKIYIELGEVNKGQEYYDKAFKILKDQ